jgi:hypothetical protein
VEMLFRTNLLALVGGGPTPRYPPNKVRTQARTSMWAAADDGMTTHVGGYSRGGGTHHHCRHVTQMKHCNEGPTGPSLASRPPCLGPPQTTRADPCSVPSDLPHQVIIWEDHSGRCIGELSFRREILAVKLRRDMVAVALASTVFVYTLRDLTLMEQMHTARNPLGLLAVSAQEDRSVLACPGLHRVRGRTDYQNQYDHNKKS